MTDPVYDKYVAQIRVLIDSYGAQNAIQAFILAFEYESTNSEQERQKQYLKSVSDALTTLYYDIEKL